MQGSINELRRRARSAGAFGVTLAFAGGLLATAASTPLLVSAQTADATPGATVESTSSCRTALVGEQTSPSLFDLSLFVPVSQLGIGVASSTPATPAPATSTATSPAAPTSAPSAGTPAASPVAATPIAATPVTSATASSVAEGEESPVADTLRELAFGVINCTSQSDLTTLGSLVTDAYLSQTFAGGADISRDDLLALAAVTVVPEQQLIAFDNVTATGDQSATAEVIYSSGNQLLHEEWSFVRDASGTGWLVDQSTALEPLAVRGSETSTVTFDENGMRTDPREVTSGNVVLIGKNEDSAEHEMLVLRLPQGTTTELLLQNAGPSLPEGVSFIGQMTVPANGEAVLPLMNLDKGNYVVVDMLLDDTGTPYLANGYRARLIVQ